MPPAAEARSPPALRGAPARPTVRYVWYYYQTPLSVFFFLGVAAPLRCQRVGAVDATRTYNSEVNEKTI